MALRRSSATRSLRLSQLQMAAIIEEAERVLEPLGFARYLIPGDGACLVCIAVLQVVTVPLVLNCACVCVCAL
jgi:hypothetical protein